MPPTISSEKPASPDNWWEIFQDNVLNDLISEGLENSPSIEQAVAVCERARSIASSARADQFPELDLNGYADRRRLPKDLRTTSSVPTGSLITPNIPSPIPTPSTGVPPIVVPPPPVPVMKNVTTPKYVNDLIANLLVSYEIDFWGKYYLTTQAAVRRTEEAEADLATAQLLLANQIALTYFTLQTTKQELSLIRQEIAQHEERINLLAKQCSHGLTNAFPILADQATLESRKADEQALVQAHDTNMTLLAVLIGREANSTTISVSEQAWTFPVVPSGLPSSLLANRPDIKSRLKEVEAVIAEIGVAKTQLLPSIPLSAAAGYQAGLAHEWFKWKNRIWSIAASFSQPLFDAGKRFAEIDIAKANFKQAASNLTQTVLNSVKEVEDALIAIKIEKERALFALRREEDLASTAQLRTDLYATGVQDYLSVLQANEDLFQARRARVHEEFNLQLGTLALMKSLGGSWELLQKT